MIVNKAIRTSVKLSFVVVVSLIVVSVVRTRWKLASAYLNGAQKVLEIAGATIRTEQGSFQLYGIIGCDKTGAPGDILGGSDHRIALESMPNGAQKGTLYFYYTSDIMGFGNDSGWKSMDIAPSLIVRGYALPDLEALKNDSAYASELRRIGLGYDSEVFGSCDTNEVEKLKAALW